MIFRWSPGIHVCLALLVSPVLWSQSNRFAAEEEWYISWGYNRSAYAESTVHMWGESPSGGAFDVTLNDARANDMPERFQAKVYFHPGLFTIPQFNARFGKKVRPNWWISAGWDHMKYKLKKEWVEAEGFAPSADFTDETPGAEIAWDGDSLYWGPGFNFEHSDGMNFVRFSAEHEHTLWTSKGGNFALRAFEAVGDGFGGVQHRLQVGRRAGKEPPANQRLRCRIACRIEGPISPALYAADDRPWGSPCAPMDSLARPNGCGSHSKCAVR